MVLVEQTCAVPIEYCFGQELLSMHEWDVAASEPCVFCSRLHHCPRELKVHEACLELWPLGRPQHRALPDRQPQQRDWNRIAMANAEVRRIVEHWEAGEQVTDQQYLRLRSLISGAATKEAADAYWHVMAALLLPKAGYYALDAAQYYGLKVLDRAVRAAFARLLSGCVIIANEFMVMNDDCVAVPSHFERIVLECLKVFLFGLARCPFRDLPQEDGAFGEAVEDEWRRVLEFGNGLHGFTVHPCIHMDDLVRYQQLRDRDHLVSWSISSWVIWSMTAFPHPVQTLAPRFGEKAFGERLVRMHESLVQSFATKICGRLEWVEGGHDEIKRRAVEGSLRALLWKLIDGYDFGRGKPKEAMLSSVGAVAPESSPALREALRARLDEFGLPFAVRDIVHIGFARYVVAKFEQWVREMYPPNQPVFAPGYEGGPALTEGSGDAAEAFAEETRKGRRKRDRSEGIRVACRAAGIDYLFRRQMAFVCRVSPDQLLKWDRSGELRALRLRDVDPFAAESVADRRVYPHTPEMIEQIEGLRDRKQALQAESCPGMLSRKQAAEALGISTRKLDQMRQAGAIATERVGHRVFIPEAEVERILAERQHAA